MFCGKNEAIKQVDAVPSGLDWKEYSAHPLKYKTCWACKQADKNSDRSALTQSMACSMFGGKLNYTTKSKAGKDYRPVFWFLRKAGKSFHDQPKTNMFSGRTKKNEYFWYPDLEQEALKRGWDKLGKTPRWVGKDKVLAGSAAETSAPSKSGVHRQGRNKRPRHPRLQSSSLELLRLPRSIRGLQCLSLIHI